MANKRWKSIASAGSIGADWVLHNLNFVLFLALMGIVYIANAHYSDKMIRKIQEQEQEIKELRWNYMTLKSQLMYASKHSEVAKAIEPYGLNNTGAVAKKIVIRD